MSEVRGTSPLVSDRYFLPIIPFKLFLKIVDLKFPYGGSTVRAGEFVFYAIQFIDEVNSKFDFMDKSLSLLPKAYQPDTFLGMHIPGLGVILSLVVLFLTGVIATNFFGRRIVALGEGILAKIPFVRTIYNAVKQVLETIFASDSKAFRKVILIEYPRKGMYSIAFQTSKGFKQGEEKTGKELITVFVPTTPNPTSGFLLMVPKSDVVELSMSVDEALKMVISLGVVLPNNGTPHLNVEKKNK